MLDNILLVAELQEYKANPERHAEGVVLEARLEKGRGPVATLLVKNGTLKRGDNYVVGTTRGRLRAMLDHKGKPIKEAPPSTPVEIIGLQAVPAAGDLMVVVGNERDAKALVDHRVEQARKKAETPTHKVTLEDLMAHGQQEETLTLNLIIKADVGGTLEAIKSSFDKLEVPGTECKILHSAVGAVTESDMMLAHINGAVIIGFNVRPDNKARKCMDEYSVDVRTYRVIYEAIDEVKAALMGLLGPNIKEVIQGMAEIRQTFKVPKIGTVAGCFVSDGKIARPHQIRLLRDGVVVWTGRLASLRRFKDDVREVEKGYECGMNLDGYNDIKPGDMLEAFTEEEVEQAAN